MRSILRAVLFDMDGTLIDSDTAVYHAILKGMEVLNIPVREDASYEKMIQYYGGSLADCIPVFIPPSYQTPETFRRIYNVVPQVYNRDLFAEEIKVFNGVKEVLLALKARELKLAVISNSPQQAVEEICGLFFGCCFDFICGDIEALHAKPDPYGLFAALKALDTTADETLYVGDTLVDVQTADAAGVRIAGALWNGMAASQELAELNRCPVMRTPEALLTHILNDGL